MNGKTIILALLAGMMPLGMMAQEDDDMYFISSKSRSKTTDSYGMPKDTYYSGSRRSIDEYNRRIPMRGSKIEPIDSMGNVTGGGIDTTDDYQYTRRMNRWDDYAWTDPYWAGYYAGRSLAWGYYDPWYDPWFDPWYTGFYDPWYYGGWYGYRGWYSPYYAGWYTPWYNRWYGYYGGWAGNWGYAPVSRYSSTGHAGTARHMTGTGRQPLNGGTFNRGTSAFSGGNGSFGSRSFSSGVANRDRRGSYSGSSGTFNAQRRFGGSRNTQSTQSFQQRENNTFSQSRSNGSSFSSGSFGGSRGAGSFGGSRGAGSFGGGSRGGGFGGRR